MNRWMAGVGAMLLLGAGVGTGTATIRPQEAPFPHERHEGLFPLCAGCHADMTSTDRADLFPDPGSCASCHDGIAQDSVAWSLPAPEPSNLTFSHEAHARESELGGEEATTCASCHVDPSGGRMSMDGYPPERCLDCHADGVAVPDHTETADCGTCHVPLSESGFSRARLLALPTPAVHEGDAFILEGHGERALDDLNRCATCHVKDQCAQCHVDVTLTPLPDMPTAPGTLDFVSIEPHYPTPVSHTEGNFLLVHELDAGIADCATCHTRNDCTSCHIDPVAAPVDELPVRADVIAPGVMLDRRQPDTHASPFFIRAHGLLSASGAGGCATCHTQTDCASCHDAPTSNAFHPDNFVSRHAADAFGQTAECANCHSTEAFCQACHLESGFGSVGRLGAGYHDAQPVWLLRHGQAARQSLETCASCHKQNDCTQCHSVLGAFQVNPHGPDFDAERARARNARICLACHVTIPGGGVQ